MRTKEKVIVEGRRCPFADESDERRGQGGAVFGLLKLPVGRSSYVPLDVHIRK